MSPRRPVPAGFTLDELLEPGVPLNFPNDEGFFSWRNFFLKADRILKLWDRYGSRSLRRLAIRKAERCMLERTRYSDGVGASYPPKMYVPTNIIRISTTRRRCCWRSRAPRARMRLVKTKHWSAR
jgi:hypothetical protein